MGAANCVAWMFEQKGTFVISGEMAGEDTLMEIALEAGADDVAAEGELFEITCRVSAFSAVKSALSAREIETISAEIAMVPSTTISVPTDKAKQVLALMEALEDHDDVQNVFANFDMSDDVLAELQQET